MEAELKDIIGESPKVTRLATGFGSASGPVFSRKGYLLFSDTGASRILKWQDGTISTFRDGVTGARGLTFDHQGRLLACEKGRLTRVEKNGSVTLLAGGPSTPAVGNPIDVVFAIDGNIYFCNGAAVFQIKRGGSVVVASRDCERPVGVGLAPNQQSMFVSDAGDRNLRVFKLAADGALSKGEVFASIDSGPPGGLKTDEAGRVWVAIPGGLQVFQHDGKPLGVAPTPEPPTGLAWAEGFRNIIVTTASSVYRMEARVNGTRTF